MVRNALVLVAVTALAAPALAAAPPEAAAIGASNALAIDLYRQVAGDPGNFVFSPTSISLAFAMAQQGAAGDTAAEMARVLHGDGKSGFPEWQKALAAVGNKSIQLDIANGFWADRTFPFRPAYLAALQHDFAARAEMVDFVTRFEPIRLDINQWVEKITHQRIKDLLPAGAVDSSTRMVIANAIYFKGNWVNKFDAAQTRERPFFAAGNKHPVKTMIQNGQFKLGHSDGVTILEMGYAKSNLAMDVILPETHDGLATVEKELDAARIAQWLACLYPQEVEVELPRWKGERSIDLAAVMQKLGMKLAFHEEKANFSSMQKPGANRPLFISRALHKAFILVDEKGSEAAAATAIVMSTADAVHEPARFHADHPFLYLIRDTRSGAILFLGRVTDPAQG